MASSADLDLDKEKEGMSARIVLHFDDQTTSLENVSKIQNVSLAFN